MFDTTAYNNLKINAVSGTLTRSHPKSKFVHFHIKSRFAEHIFSTYPTMNKDAITVIQIMLCGEGVLLVEYVRDKDVEAEQV